MPENDPYLESEEWKQALEEQRRWQQSPEFTSHIARFSRQASSRISWTRPCSARRATLPVSLPDAAYSHQRSPARRNGLPQSPKAVALRPGGSPLVLGYAGDGPAYLAVTHESLRQKSLGSLSPSPIAKE